jgi:hypothetical protein
MTLIFNHQKFHIIFIVNHKLFISFSLNYRNFYFKYLIVVLYCYSLINFSNFIIIILVINIKYNLLVNNLKLPTMNLFIDLIGFDLNLIVIDFIFFETNLSIILYY